MFGILAKRWEPGQRIDWHNVTGGRPLDWYLARGFKVCDGQNGTPNLIDKFVKYQDEASEGSTGGAKTVTPSGGVQNHTLSKGQLASHDHVAPAGSNTGGGCFGDIGGKAVAGRLNEVADLNSGNVLEGNEYMLLVDVEGSSEPHNHGLQMNSQENEPQHVCCVPLIFLPGA